MPSILNSQHALLGALPPMPHAPHMVLLHVIERCHGCVQEEQVEYLEDSEVDFSSDDDDEEDDMEDLAGPDGSMRSAGHLGKRPSGIPHCTTLFPFLHLNNAHAHQSRLGLFLA